MDKIKSRLAPVLWYAAVLSGLLIVILPFAWAIASSLRPLSVVFRYTTPFSLRALVPIPFTLEAYANIFQKGFGRALLNTVFVCAATILGGLLLNSLAGFVFSKLRFPGKSIVFTIVLVTFMIPFEVIAIPLYMVARNLGILNTYAALILPGIANGLAIFLFKQFFDEIPSDLIDAARVDGASPVLRVRQDFRSPFQTCHDHCRADSLPLPVERVSVAAHFRQFPCPSLGAGCHGLFPHRKPSSLE